MQLHDDTSPGEDDQQQCSSDAEADMSVVTQQRSVGPSAKDYVLANRQILCLLKVGHLFKPLFTEHLAKRFLLHSLAPTQN